ncbi:hypothetical protein HK405_001179, partial [Cladochytrium tenue]
DTALHEDRYNEPASKSDDPTALGAAETAATTTATTITPSNSAANDADDCVRIRHRRGCHAASLGLPPRQPPPLLLPALNSALSRSTLVCNTLQLSNGKPSVSFYEEPGAEEGADFDADDALEHDSKRRTLCARDDLIENGVLVWAGDLFADDDDDDGMNEDTRLA